MYYQYNKRDWGNEEKTQNFFNSGVDGGAFGMCRMCKDYDVYGGGYGNGDGKQSDNLFEGRGGLFYVRGKGFDSGTGAGYPFVEGGRL